MGNLDAKRDWGHARDFVKMQWLMLQQEFPEDFVIATGKQHTVREFIEWSANELGINVKFHGKGKHEIVIVDSIKGNKAPALSVGDVIVRIDTRYYRPSEVETLLGDASKAAERLGWSSETTAKEMCKEMIAEDLIKTKTRISLKN